MLNLIAVYFTCGRYGYGWYGLWPTWYRPQVLIPTV